jgi:hypothetical protein
MVFPVFSMCWFELVRTRLSVTADDLPPYG